MDNCRDDSDRTKQTFWRPGDSTRTKQHRFWLSWGLRPDNFRNLGRNLFFIKIHYEASHGFFDNIKGNGRLLNYCN